MFAGKHSWGNTKPFAVEPFRRRPFSRAPVDSILHWDADIDAFSEQTGGVHTFNHAVLSPQYQRNADGSYANVGAKPAVDVFGGKKWLRSCGAVTNLALVTPELMNATLIGNAFNPTSVDSVHILYLLLNNGISVPYFVSATLKSNGVRYAKFVQYDRWQNFDLQDGVLSGTSGWTNATIEDLGGGYYRCSAIVIPSVLQRVYVTLSPNNTAHWDDIYLGDPTKGIIVRDYQVSQVAYPVPYVPPGVTQPASNATTTNGSWFSLPDGSPLWQALTGQPLTLATRVRMGVGSGDLAAGGFGDVVSCIAMVFGLQYFEKTFSGSEYIIRAYDRSSVSGFSIASWPRNSIVRRVTQVNTAGTQFRVGYMIEGTHTAIQWSSWANFDGSFGPSTLYRLMLGYSNAYPMWFNKITAWRKQVTDAEILEAMA